MSFEFFFFAGNLGAKHLRISEKLILFGGNNSFVWLVRRPHGFLHAPLSSGVLLLGD